MKPLSTRVERVRRFDALKPAALLLDMNVSKKVRFAVARRVAAVDDFLLRATKEAVK